MAGAASFSCSIFQLFLIRPDSLKSRPFVSAAECCSLCFHLLCWWEWTSAKVASFNGRTLTHVRLVNAAMSEIKTWAFWRAVLAELLGMMIFVFVGLSAAIGDKNNTYPDQEIKVAFAFGSAIATLVQCIGHVSGAHLNPAVTLGLLTSCQTSILRAFFYIIAQILGAMAGSAIVYGIRPEIIDSLGLNKVRLNLCAFNYA